MNSIGQSPEKRRPVEPSVDYRGPGGTRNPLRSLRFVAAALLLAVAAGVAAGERESEWPGLPPDCWSEARIFHAGNDGNLWEKNTRISRLQAERPKPGEYSPNKGYYFVRSGDWPTARIVIYAEKDDLTQIEFTGLSGLGGVAWINEKLLSIRVWWGRATGNDLIFDVESGEVIHSEQFWDGAIARSQFIESCPKVGCTCIAAGKGR